MVILVDGTTNCTQAVVTVGQHIWHGEFGHAGSTSGLDDAHIGDVVACHAVELQLQGIHVVRLVVSFQDRIGHRAFCGIGFCDGASGFLQDFGFLRTQI